MLVKQLFPNWKKVRTISGAGEPFVAQSQKEKLLGFVKDVMKDTDDSFRKNFVDALADLEPDDWVAIKEFVKKLLKD